MQQQGIRRGGPKMAGRALAGGAVALLAGAGLVPLSAPAGASTPTTLYVADQNCSCVWQVPPGGAPQVYEGSYESDQDVAVDSAGNLYWTEAQDNAVRELDAGQVKTLASGYEPVGIAVDGSGNVFFGTFGGTAGSAGLYEIPSGGSAQLLSSFGGPWISAAVDGNDDIWGVGGSDNLLLWPAGASGPVEIDLPGVSSVTGVRLDAANDLFASTGYGGDAVELAAGGTASTDLGSVGEYTEGIAVDTNGNVFVGEPSGASGYGKVFEITPGGSPTLYASGEIAQTGGLAVNPTPVPASRRTTTVALSSSVTSSSITTITPVDLTATVSSGGGLVQFDDNGSPLGQPVAISGGTAEMDTTLPSGSAEVTATYLGDTADAPSSSAPLTYQVSPAASTTTISAPDGTRVPGDSYATVQVTVTGAGATPTGSAEILANGVDVGSVELTNGTGTTTVDITPGSSLVTADYLGDDVYSTSESSGLTFTTVPPYTPEMTGTVTYGARTSSGARKATITVTMTGFRGASFPTGHPTATDGFTCSSLKKTAVGSLESTTTCTKVVPKNTHELVDVRYAATSDYTATSTLFSVTNGTSSGGGG